MIRNKAIAEVNFHSCLCFARQSGFLTSEDDFAFFEEFAFFEVFMDFLIKGDGGFPIRTLKMWKTSSDLRTFLKSVGCW